MRKKVCTFTLLLLCLALVLILPGKAEAAAIVDGGQWGDNLTWTIDTDGVVIIEGEGPMKEYSDSAYTPWTENQQITEVIIRPGVTYIGRNAFARCRNLTTVTIPDTVTGVGFSAFTGCEQLSEITFSQNISSVGMFAFDGTAWYEAQEEGIVYVGNVAIGYQGICSETLTFRDGTVCIAGSAFSWNENLQSVVIPDSVTEIGSDAFCYCSNLSQITMSSNITAIASDAFDGTAWYSSQDDGIVYIGDVAYAVKGSCSEVMTIREGTRVLASELFNWNETVTQIHLPASVTTIGVGAFSDCEALTSITIDESNPSYCIDECGVLYNKDKTHLITALLPISGSYTVPDTVTVIGARAFFNQGQLTQLTLGSNVTTIEQAAFSYCDGLTSLVIPDSVKRIEKKAFQGCSGLTELTLGTNVSVIGEWAFSNCNGLTALTLPDSVTFLGEYVFYYCQNLVSLRIGSGLNYIDGGAFNGCTSLGGFSVSQDNACYCTDSTGILFDKNKTALIKAPATFSGSYTVPVGVQVIQDSAFYQCSGLTALTLPDSLTTIGENAFYRCGELTSVDFGEGLQYIDTWAFQCCEKLTAVVLPDSVTTLGDAVFANCTGLTSVTLSSNLTSVAYSAFSGCSTLTQITLKEGLQTIGDYAFSRCTALTAVAIPNSVTSIGNNAFYACNTLSSVTLGGAQTIGEYAFQDCSGLTSITIPDSVTTIGSQAFRNCTGLTKVSFGKGLTIIRSYTFSNCTALTDYTLPQNLTEIASYAFYGCPGPEELVIPDSVTYIGNSAFYPSTNLTTLTLGKNVSNMGSLAFGFDGAQSDVYITDVNSWCNVTLDGNVYLTSSGTIHLLDENGKEITELVLDDSVTAIGSSVFQGMKNITSATIPDSVTSIGDRAFSGCTGLTEISIPNSVVSIGSSVFNGCTGLTDVMIPDSVTDLGSSVFYNCTNLKNVTLGKGITELGYGVFQKCTSLEAVFLPEGLLTIGERAFYNCKLLQQATIPTTVTVIDDEAFYNCMKIESLPRLDNLTMIGQKAFSQCSSLCEVTFGNNLTSIGDYAFGNCSMSSVVLPDNITTLGKGAFQYIDELTRITLPGSLKTVSTQLLRGCLNLTSVTISEGITTIGDEAFSTCPLLQTVTIPSSVISIGNYAFDLNSDIPGETGVEQVIYYGTEDQWNTISIGEYNDPLLTAEKVFQPHSYGEYVVIRAATCMDDGVQGRTCSICGHVDTQVIPALLGPSTVTVDPSVYPYPESSHDYPSNANDIQTFTYPGAASLTVTFSSSSITESGYDMLYILDKDDHQIAELSGTLSGQVVTIPGDTFQVKLTSDGSLQKWGYSFSQIVADVPVSHSYESGVCTVCGAKDPDAPAVVITGVSRAKTLSLDGIIYIKATVAFMNGDKTANADGLTNSQVLQNGRLLFWKASDLPENTEDAVLGTQTISKKLVNAGVYEGIQEFYAYSHGIAAKEYNDTIYYRTYIEVDGEAYYGDIIAYSVVNYCQSQFKKTTDQAEAMKPLLAAMLNYGAAAQTQFGYRTDALANGCLQTYVDQNLLDASHLTMSWNDELLTDPAAPSAEMAVNFQQNDVKRTARTLALEGAIEAKMTFGYKVNGDVSTKLPDGATATFYFWTGSDYDALAAAGTPLSMENASYALTGDDIVETYSSKYGYEYNANSDGIAAKRLGETLYIAAVFTVDGVDYCSGIEAYSPEVYAKAQLAKTSTTENLANLLKWMTIYGEQAKTYFAS